MSNEIGKQYLNDNTGWKIEIRKESIGKWFSEKLGGIKLMAFTAIADIIKIAILLPQNESKKPSILKFASIVSVEGKIFPFLFNVKELNGKFIYHSILIFKESIATKKQKPGGLSGLELMGDPSSPFLRRWAKATSLTATKIRNGVEKQRVLSNQLPIKVNSVNVQNVLSGVVSAQDISKLSFKKIDLEGQYKKEFGLLYSDTQLMIWGQPGNGKTVWLLKFAQYLAEKLGQRVLYVANEEWNRSTLTEKIIQFQIGHDNLKISKDLNSLKSSGLTIEDFDVVFFDSINSLGMDLKSYKEFIEKNPGRIYVLIVQSTKDGDFRGGKDWEHEVDIAGEILQRNLELRKNRLDKEFLTKQLAKEAKAKSEKQKEKETQKQK